MRALANKPDNLGSILELTWWERMNQNPLTVLARGYTWEQLPPREELCRAGPGNGQ